MERSTMTNDREASPNESDSTGGATPSSSSRRFQFSLATLLWLTTLAACLVALWSMYRELRQARNELRAARDEVQVYRGEMGYLDVSDPNKVYAHGIRTVETNKWSWRVHVPDKPNYRLCVATKRIPAEGIPPCNGSLSSLDSGEVLVDASAGASPDGKWRVTVKVTKRSGLGSVAYTVGTDMNPLAGATQGRSVDETSQECLNPGSPLVLLRWREAKKRQGSVDWDPQPCDGIMIWIEEAK
jgi:hypothetical protein